MKFILFYLVLLLSLSVSAQNDQQISLEIGTEIPLNYSVGASIQIESNVELVFKAGILTKPYDAIILNTLSALGIDESITNTVEGAFTHGLVFKPGVNYSFSGFYTGVFYSFFSLNAADVPTDLINNFYGINLPVVNIYDLTEYKLKSNLHNLGIVIGKLIPLNDQFTLGTEFSIAKTISSNSSISSTYDEDMNLATGYVQNDLAPLYLKYAFLPSLNVFIRFRL